MDKKADLHIHSSASDGLLSPSECVRAALQANLAAAAITDHDTVDGVAEALRAGDEYGIEVVPGVEISALHGEKLEVHILGYYIDHTSPDINNLFETLRNARLERAAEMVRKLNEIGIGVTLDRVLELAKGGAVGRPHVARAIVEQRAAYGIDSAFGKYLVDGSPAYVPRYKITPHEAVDAIIAAGGVACCAHVAKLKRDDLVIDLASRGLKAIEAQHPDHGRAASRFYDKFARQRGLVPTGGSDAHCFPGDTHGGIGSVTVGYEIVEELKHLAGRC